MANRGNIRTRVLALVILISMLFSSFDGFTASAASAAVTVSGFNDTNQLNVPHSGNIIPVKLDDDVTISGGGYSDGYLLFQNTGAKVGGDVLSILSDSNPKAYGAISLDGSSLYLGNGSGKDLIGSIDGTLNGRDGKDLKILFSTYLPNGGFEAGSSNWSSYNNFVTLSGDSSLTSSGTTTVEVKTKNPYFNWNWVDTVDGSSSYMRLYLSCQIKDRFGTLHGPKITSNTFSAGKGDYVALYYYAKNTGDKYDVYGYLKDQATGKTQQLFYQRGDETNGWQEVNAQITLPTSDNFVFEFLCGSQDGTGGRYISSELLVDNVRVLSDKVNSQVVTNVARRVAMTVASQTTRTSTAERTYRLTAVDGSGNSGASATTATVKVHTYPAPPVIGAAPVSGTTDTLDLNWSAVDATAYDVYLNGTQVLNVSPNTTRTITGLSPNEAVNVRVIGKNDMGSSEETSADKYSNAAVPSVSLLSASTNSILLVLGNNGNASGTAYCLERSTDGTSWTVANNFAISSAAGPTTAYTDTGLSANTVYYYRVKARNGNGVQTGYSASASRLTAPAAPNPVTVTASSVTSDSLDISWTAPAGAQSYNLYSGSTSVGTGLTVTSKRYSGLLPNTSYTVSVTAVNAGGESVASSQVTRYTLAALPGVTLGSETTSSITLTLGNNGNPTDTLYWLERSIDQANWTQMLTDGLAAGTGEARTFVASGLNPGTTYYFRVRAQNGDGVNSAYTPAVSAVTVPVAPTGLTVTPGTVSDDQTASLMLSWTAPVGATSYDIYRMAGGEESFTKIETSYAGGTLYNDEGLTPNRQYTYYIVAKNAGGDSLPSGEKSAYTLASVPSITSEVSGGTINLTIASNGNPGFASGENPSGTAYFIQYATSTDGGENWGDWTDLPGGWISYLMPQHSDISSGLTYRYRVKAKNTDGVETDYSGSTSARSNVAPMISITAPAADQVRSAQTGHTVFTLSGTVSDADGDTVKISAAIDGKKKTTVVPTTAEGAPWSLSWDIASDGISQGSYNSIAVTGDDGYKGVATEYAGFVLSVDKTGPGEPGITAATNWTNAASVPVTITAGSDLAAGAGYSEYKLSGAAVSGWQTYTGSFSITAAGETTVTARTVDAVGNVGAEQSATVKIDRTSPTGGFIAISGDTAYSGSVNVNLTLAASDAGGAGNGTDPDLPKEMQLSNRSDFTSASWETYQTTRSWTLSSGDGEKTVYVRFRDSVGNVSEPISDSIILDGAAPVISISSPSSFNVKKGTTVTYELTMSEKSTLTGINTDDPSNIDLTVFGSFSDEDVAAIKAAVTITEKDETHHTVHILIPNSLGSSQGTIGIRVLAGAAVDSAGNSSVLSVGNASFVIDTIAPGNQDELFTAGITVQGGQGVTLAKSSEACDGGYDSDSVRFAPASYDGTAPANGTTITSTHGRSTVINAPTNEGTYYLYVIDAAGNLSPASIAALTVKNNGPTLSLAGPSAQYVRADSSVSYTVTYSSDTTSITLDAEDVGLITTGTANGYVRVGTVDGQPLQRTVTLYNLMGEGTVQIRIAGGSATDAEGNPASASAVSAAVTVDNTPASAEGLEFFSSYALNPDQAKKGDTLNLILTANEPLHSVTGTIAGQSVSFTPDVSGTVWTAQFTIPTDNTMNSLDGTAATFSAVMTDLTGNVSEAVTQAEATGGVTLDFTAPVLEVTGDKDTDGYFCNGAAITFNEGTCVVTDAYSGSNELDSGAIIYDDGIYTATVTDLAGNQTSQTFTVSYGATVLALDIGNLKIGYAEGDSAQSITRDLTLPLKSDSGAAVSWSVKSGTAVLLDGIASATEDTYEAAVTRPAYSEEGNNDAAVVLTATITIEGKTASRDFDLTVKANTNTADGLGLLRDDAESARIVYADGDSRTSVTDDISLGDTGVLNGSAIKWTSDSDAIVISEAAAGGFYTGTVTRPTQSDAVVTLTATATDAEDNTKFVSIEYVLTVKAAEVLDSEKAKADYELVDILYAEGDSAQSVTQNLTFSADVTNGSTVIWTSSDKAHVSDTGAVTRPVESEGNKDVTITATVTNGTAVINKRFTVTVIRRQLTPAEILDADLADLNVGYYGDDDADSVTTHVILTALGARGSTVTWESDTESAVAPDGTVCRGTANQTVILTATVTYGELTDTKTFTLTVKATDSSDILKQIKDDTDELFVGYADGDSADYVTKDLKLCTLGANGSTITWGSSNESLVSSSGTVNSTGSGGTVLMSATVKKYSAAIGYWVSRTKSFTVTVYSAGTLNLESDLDDVEIGYADGDSAQSVTSSVYLAKEGATGCTISWTSSNPSYVTGTGVVTRPGPDGTDHSVTLTAAITNPVTRATATKVFELNIVKMTDQDAVSEAARQLGADDAFDFENGNDIWESVTGEFLILTSGLYDTDISWTSGNPDAVSIGGVDSATGKLNATVTRPSGSDVNVILTAVFTRGDASAAKTYLLVVKAEGTTRVTTRSSSSGITFDLTSTDGQQQLTAYRTVDVEGETTTNIDTVILVPGFVSQLTEDINPTSGEAGRTLILDMPITDTDEQAIEIPSASVASMADHNALLVIRSPFADITLPADLIRSLSDQGTDLYLRIVPITDEQGRADVSDETLDYAGSTTQLLGIPRMVETNYTGGSTYVTLPFDGSGLTDLYGILVYIRHSDGSQELQSGNLVYENDGKTPCGIQIEVDSFSDFQVVKVASDDYIPVSVPGVTTAGDLEDALDTDGSYTVESDGLQAEIDRGDLDFDSLAEQFGENVVPEDMELEISLGYLPLNKQYAADDTLSGAGYDMAGTPFSFSITASYKGQTADVSPFGGYVKFRVPLTDGQKITTAVRIGEDGSIIHIPTFVTVEDGKYYAEIHSLVGGTFALIWNPEEMDDMVSHWGKSEVNDMASRLVVFGEGNHLYNPDRDVTRAEFAAILVRALGLVPNAGGENFTDVDGAKWYAEYLGTAEAYGLIYGYGDGRFGPDDLVTREQAMTMIARAAKLAGLDMTVTDEQLQIILGAFPDQSEISDFAETAAAGCVMTGVILGRDGKTISPKEDLSRAEAAAIVRRLLRYSGMID